MAVRLRYRHSIPFLTAVSGLVNSTNDYVQQAQQAEIDFALGKMTNTHELGVYQQEANIASAVYSSNKG